MKLITKCCVCGSILSVTTRGQDFEERISHGMCKKCENRGEVQIMIFNDDMGIFILDCAYLVQGELFYKEKKVPFYVSVGVFPIHGKLNMWEPNLGFYEEIETKTFTCRTEEKMAQIKNWAKELKTLIVLGG